MVEIIVGALIGALFSMIPIWAYRKGLSDSFAIKEDKPIEPIKTPVSIISEVVRGKKDKQLQDEVMKGLNNILNYDGSKQKE